MPLGLTRGDVHRPLGRGVASTLVMTVLELAITAVVGLLGGAVGGVLFAARISHLTEAGRRRYEAETTLRGVLRTYREKMIYHRAEVAVRGFYPQDYASLESQEELAEVVLRELPYLPRRTRRELRAHLEALVGPLAIGLAEGRAFVPKSFRSTELESARLNTALSELIAEGDAEGMKRGQLGAVQKSVENPDVHDAAIATLDTMIALVPVDAAFPFRLSKINRLSVYTKKRTVRTL